MPKPKPERQIIRQPIVNYRRQQRAAKLLDRSWNYWAQAVLNKAATEALLAEAKS